MDAKYGRRIFLLEIRNMILRYAISILKGQGDDKERLEAIIEYIGRYLEQIDNE